MGEKIFDPSEIKINGETIDAYVTRIREEQGARANGHDAGGGKRIELLWAKDIKPKAVEWIWKHWLARGKWGLLVGDTSAGKSTIAFSCASIISCGGAWPDGTLAKQGIGAFFDAFYLVNFAFDGGNLGIEIVLLFVERFFALKYAILGAGYLFFLFLK